ncbi:MAG: hypothetical protein NXH85_04665 [Pseudomonadaceae bacterium]|nr:hypothetical protein [Pseudomonadaceae bacterium]
MTKPDDFDVEEFTQAGTPGPDADPDRPFRIWRLLGVIGIVLVGLAAASAVVDILVLGPLEGRAF